MRAESNQVNVFCNRKGMDNSRSSLVSRIYTQSALYVETNEPKVVPTLSRKQGLIESRYLPRLSLPLEDHCDTGV